MRIQGSHLNLGFMQALASQKKQGQSLGTAEELLNNSAGVRLGQALSINTAKPDYTSASSTSASPSSQTNALSKPLSPSAQATNTEPTLGEVFADEIIRRMEADGFTVTDENGATKDTTELRHSLADTMDWVRERYGDDAASAATGMIIQSTSGGIDEDSLGTGLLDTLKLIDRNFGIAAGDEAISTFNSGINNALNDYFDNGLMEEFHAVASSADETSATQNLSARIFTKAVSDSDSSDSETVTEQLLASLKQELENVAELQDLTSQLEAQFNPANPSQATLSNAISAYTDQPVPSVPQFTSIAV